MKHYIQKLLDNMPEDWLKLTTHRLDIYTEKLAKTEFLDQFEILYHYDKASTNDLGDVPTAFDYIRLGHPLSCVLEWMLAKRSGLNRDNVISFSSSTMPILAVLRENALEKKATQIYYTGTQPKGLDVEVLKNIYGYSLDLNQVQSINDIPVSNGSNIFISVSEDFEEILLNDRIDFHIRIHPKLGSVIFVNGDHNSDYVSRIQHVRRRETIAMTPADCKTALHLLSDTSPEVPIIDHTSNTELVKNTIRQITGTDSNPLLASSGLSMQYAIMMGLIHHAKEEYGGKEIKIIVPPNCYGGTNDQARRVAASIEDVAVMDLPVDGDHNMVQSIEIVLEEAAKIDAVPFVIAEIPTNPRVEVPDLNDLRTALNKIRKTPSGQDAVAPVFILDQTFCPNVQFLGEKNILSDIPSISYVSGSKFPSGGRCTAGYCVANAKAEALMTNIAEHLTLCDNQATALQVQILAEQLPSMLERIHGAYLNTRAFVNFIQETLPEAKINFVSEALAEEGFTPSVFSLDLPTKGATDAERESYKRELNHRLIQMMINEIPDESKYCVSYGQLKGCYWTIPATSTQGTTKEKDKDYIARVALSPNMDLEHHKKVFQKFVAEL